MRMSTPGNHDVSFIRAEVLHFISLVTWHMLSTEQISVVLLEEPQVGLSHISVTVYLMP